MNPSPPLHSVSIVTTPEAEDAVAELLLRETGQPATITQVRATGLSTVAVFLPDPPPHPWKSLRLRLRQGLDRIAECGLAIAPGTMTRRRVPSEDWRESWKRHFKPLVIGKHLLVRASWHSRRPVPGQAQLVLDPGLSFGTGQHPTTEFCLRELVRLRPSASQPRSLLDVGTGSGILALAAIKLGFRPVDAFDFDPEAVAIAHRNATRNRVPGALTCRQADVARLPVPPRTRFDVVCANLTANLLLQYAPRLAAQLKPGGVLVLAGILAEEFSQVRACFEKLGLAFGRDARRKEWHSGSFRLPEP